MDGLTISAIWTAALTSVGGQTMRLIVGFTVACFLIGSAAKVSADPAATSPGLSRVLDDLLKSASSQQYSQIKEAIDASPDLAKQLDELSRSGLLSGIKVLPERTTNLPFDGYIEGSTITVTTALLAELRKSRIFDVVTPSDVLPNNTAFVLAHLAQHLRTASEMQRALKTTPNPTLYTEIRLKDEAVAFIEGWNVVVDIATQGGTKQLSSAQIATLLMNTRYRFAFLGSKLSTSLRPRSRHRGV